MERPAPDLFLFFEKLYIKLGQVVSILVSMCFGIPRRGDKILASCVKLQNGNLETCPIWGRRSGTSASAIFCAWFFNSIIIHVIFYYSINWPSFIFWLLLILQISTNMCSVISNPVCDVINFNEIKIKLFSYMTKKSEQKLKYIKNKKCF